MKKLIIFPAVACLLSMGGTTAVVVKTHTPAPVAADSVKVVPDTVVRDSATPPPVHPDSVRTDTSHAAADSAVKRIPLSQAAPAPVMPPMVGPPSRPLPAMTQADPAARAAAYKQVARVLAAMKPVEAAKVLAYLSDDEVEGILRAVGPRQAADFLTNIPKERAAGLSRRLLVPKEQGS